MAPALARLTKTLGERFDYPEQWDKTKNAALTPIRERPGRLAAAGAARDARRHGGHPAHRLRQRRRARCSARSKRRAGELAVRSALGADRRRITQQLVDRGAGGRAASPACVGALLAAAGFRVLAGALPLGAWAERAVLDWTLFGAAIALAILAALGIALVPALSLWRGDLRDALTRRADGRRAVAAAASRAGWWSRGRARGAPRRRRRAAHPQRREPVRHRPGGGHPRRGGARRRDRRSMKTPERQRTMRTLLGELEQLPGVRSAALDQQAAAARPRRQLGDRRRGAAGPPDSHRPTFRFVSRDYFRDARHRGAPGARLRQPDRPDGELAVVINEALAKKYFPGVDPIGRRLRQRVRGLGARSWAWWKTWPRRT